MSEKTHCFENHKKMLKEQDQDLSLICMFFLSRKEMWKKTGFYSLTLEIARVKIKFRI